MQLMLWYACLHSRAYIEIQAIMVQSESSFSKIKKYSLIFQSRATILRQRWVALEFMLPAIKYINISLLINEI